MGTSVFYSSGDDGVAGGGGVCLNAQREWHFTVTCNLQALDLKLSQINRSEETALSSILISPYVLPPPLRFY
jgi:hypothetical protein